MKILRSGSVWQKFGRFAWNSTETVFFHKISTCVFWSIGQCHLWNHRPHPAIWLPSHPKHLRCIRKVIYLRISSCGSYMMLRKTSYFSRALTVPLSYVWKFQASYHVDCMQRHMQGKIGFINWEGYFSRVVG